MAGDPSEFALFDWQDFQYQDSPVQNGSHKLHRLVFSGGIAFSPLASAVQTENISMLWAVYLADTEDTDTQLWGTTGNVFSTHQVLKFNTRTWYNTEIEASNKTDNVAMNIPIRFDLKFKRPLRWLPDHQIILNIQFLEDITATMGSATLTGLTRCVCQPAGMGR